MPFPSGVAQLSLHALLRGRNQLHPFPSTSGNPFCINYLRLRCTHWNFLYQHHVRWICWKYHGLDVLLNRGHSRGWSCVAYYSYWVLFHFYVVVYFKSHGRNSGWFCSFWCWLTEIGHRLCCFPPDAHDQFWTTRILLTFSHPVWGTYGAKGFCLGFSLYPGNKQLGVCSHLNIFLSHFSMSVILVMTTSYSTLLLVDGNWNHQDIYTNKLELFSKITLAPLTLLLDGQLVKTTHVRSGYGGSRSHLRQEVGE